MDIQEFAALVHKMRLAQNKYFRQGKTVEDLFTSKAIEGDVDRAVKEILSKQGKLL